MWAKHLLIAVFAGYSLAGDGSKGRPQRSDFANGNGRESAHRRHPTSSHTACWMTTGGKRWRRYEISAIATAYPRPHPPASQLP